MSLQDSQSNSSELEIDYKVSGMKREFKVVESKRRHEPHA